MMMMMMAVKQWVAIALLLLLPLMTSGSVVSRWWWHGGVNDDDIEHFTIVCKFKKTKKFTTCLRDKPNICTSRSFSSLHRARTCLRAFYIFTQNTLKTRAFKRRSLVNARTLIIHSNDINKMHKRFLFLMVIFPSHWQHYRRRRRDETKLWDFVFVVAINLLSH